MEHKRVYHDEFGVRRTLVTDDNTPYHFATFTEVDMEKVIDSIKQKREDHPQRSTNKLVAQVPLTIFERSIHEQWDDADWKRWLNDPDNAAFRVWRGRV